MTRTDLVRGLPLAALLAIGAARICGAQTADARPLYVPPEKTVRLTAKAAATLAEAKTAALVAIDVAHREVVSYDKKTSETVVVKRGGIRRGVSAEKAKSELLDSMGEWNRFTIVDDPGQADVIVVVFEDTVEPSRFSKANGDRKHRMRERLAVFLRGDAERPLWADEVRESTFGAITGSPVGKVVDKLREDMERAANGRK
jgi:hypothetical protein